ncbi:MAG TPA: hypothetical protein DEP72_05660 [Clostridiales bacterium]|nr:MAG: hypothetical protein A2Y18_02750 [Clostridiales bacterium GWD2_32_19]HCC07629.1 hypothetical protein [Clostridiales bacterium]
MKNYKEIYEKFIKGGDKTLRRLIFAFIIGLILMNISNFVFDKKDTNIQETTEKTMSLKEEDSKYKTTIEKRLSKALENVPGAGKTEVIINIEENKDNFNDKANQVKGVLVISEGAGNLKVKEEIQKATQILLDLPIHKVYVLGNGNLK